MTEALTLPNPMGRPHYYVLDGKTPKPCNFKEWCEQFEKFDQRRVALTRLTAKVFVSTVFLGTDHNWTFEGPPILFETMVFGGPLDGEQLRTSTWEDAKFAHLVTFSHARDAIWQRMRKRKRTKKRGSP